MATPPVWCTAPDRGLTTAEVSGLARFPTRPDGPIEGASTSDQHIAAVPNLSKEDDDIVRDRNAGSNLEPPKRGKIPRQREAPPGEKLQIT